jgi:hypothetical protein
MKWQLMSEDRGWMEKNEEGESPDDNGINNVKGQESERSCIFLLPKQKIPKYSGSCPSDLPSSHLVLILQAQNYVRSVPYILFPSCQLALFGYPD